MENPHVPLNTNFVLLTGASSGIGREMAISLSERYRLILNGRNEGRLQETLSACSRCSDHLIWAHDLADVSLLGEHLAAFLTMHEAKVHSFIHCGAVMKILPLRSFDVEQNQLTFNTNFFSAVEIASTLVKKKINDRELSRIVFISSIASQFGAKGLSMYCASKGALDSFMKALAVELAPRVTVNSVLPGGIRTKMTEKIFEDPIMVEKFTRDYPLGIGDPTDVINMVEFLLSEKAGWVTGQQMVVDGGRTANITA